MITEWWENPGKVKKLNIKLLKETLINQSRTHTPWTQASLAESSLVKCDLQNYIWETRTQDQIIWLTHSPLSTSSSPTDLHHVSAFHKSHRTLWYPHSHRPPTQTKELEVQSSKTKSIRLLEFSYPSIVASKQQSNFSIQTNSKSQVLKNSSCCCACYGTAWYAHYQVSEMRSIMVPVKRTFFFLNKK